MVLFMSLVLFIWLYYGDVVLYICSHNSSFVCTVPFDIISTMDWFAGQYGDERFVDMVHQLNATHFLDTVNKFEQYFNTGFDQFF